MTTARPTAPLAPRIEALAPKLRKLAAHRTGTAYSQDLAGMATEAQDLYQASVAQILQTCHPDDTDSYLLHLANWRMLNAQVKARREAEHIQDDENDDDDDGNGELNSILDLIPDGNSDPESALIEAQDFASLIMLVSGMKPAHVEVINMLASGLSPQEIATQLGITNRAVRLRIKAIRATLAPTLLNA